MSDSRSVRRSSSSRFRQWSLAAKSTAVLLGVILLVSFLLIIIIGQIAYRALFTNRIDELERASQVEAVHLASQLDREVTELEAFAATYTIQEGLQDQSNVTDVATAVDTFCQQSPGTEVVALVSLEGEVIALSPSSGEPPEINHEKWTWFYVAQHEIFIAGALDDGLTGVKGIHFSVPITSTGTYEVLGVLYVVMNPEYFLDYSPENTDRVLAVYLPNGTTMITSDRSRAVLPVSVKKQIVSSSSGALISDTAYGYTNITDLHLNFSPASQLDWIITIQQPASLLLSEVRETTLTLQLLITAGAALLCAGVFLIRHLFFRPLRALANTGERLSSTSDLNISVPDAESQDLKAISVAFNTLLERLKHRALQFETAARISRENVSQDVDTLLERIARTIYERLAYPEIYIYQTEPDGMRAAIKAAYGKSESVMLNRGHSVVLSKKNIVGRALLQNETQWYEGLQTTFAGKADEPAEVVIPFHEATPGGLHVVGSGPYSLSQSDIDILHLLANQIGAILENRRLFAEAESAKEDAEASRAEAERANQVKSQFLASMSHELRTPLNAVLNFSKFVSSGMLGPVNEEQKDVLEKIAASGKHLLDLINDVLDISKIESGNLRLFIEEDINIGAEVEEVVAAARALLSNKQIDLNTDIDPDLPLIIGDKRRIRQIMLNLVSNACKFTNTGSITIEMHGHDGEVQFSVQDTGPGIAAEDHETIFESFRQTEEGLRQGEGTGLGLPIARRLSEAHGGRLWLESQLGEGATFYMVLPARSEKLAEILEKERQNAS